MVIQVIEEPVLFEETKWQKLRFIPEQPIKLRIHLYGENSSFQAGRDYLYDEETSRIRRMKNSRIPDWSTHPLYGKESFNHILYNNYSNQPYTCVVRYTYKEFEEIEESRGEINKFSLSQLFQKIDNKEKGKYVVFGDSISAGHEASASDKAYPFLFWEWIKRQFPKAHLEIVNHAHPGESTRGALQRVEKAVIQEQPDLVSIAYGMNDQTRQVDGTNAIPIEEFRENISTMIQEIREKTDADILLFTSCLPNPRWVYTSENIEQYAEVIRSFQPMKRITVVDVQKEWQKELKAGKKIESLLLNNLNHPNDYGHHLYLVAIKKALF